ncbi:molybdopterin molybdenumtransferase [Microbulbifer aestuariivivens]|uniref:Molybdopterin molybdenumtransferase n=1 Tax=Microbulbifer aestuariivivens TaxID=1908308 RepID=A0ABP9WKE8_9GAMM
MSDCCSQPGLLPVATAREKLLNALQPVSDEECVDTAMAAGRIVAKPVTSTLDLPPCDNSAMDGYAIRFADLQSGKPLEVIGRAFAGTPFTGSVNPGTCVRIMTGAVLPDGADTVVMQEQAEAEGGFIRVSGRVSVGDHIRQRGEDIRDGDALLAPGTRITVAHIALMAAAGVHTVTVKRRPKVALFSTGDELRQPGTPLRAGDIYDSNRPALRAALSEMHLEVLDLGTLPDSRAAIAEALQRAAREADAIISSGGVSVGEADYTREVLEEQGEISFWKVAMKPGKPFAFGRLGNTPFFGLPGNPVSALVTFYQLVVPALTHIQGKTWTAPPTLQAKLQQPLKKKPGRTDFQRGIFQNDAANGLVVDPVGLQGSHILSGLAAANCFIVLPQDSGPAQPGDLVTIEPLR